MWTQGSSKCRLGFYLKVYPTMCLQNGCEQLCLLQMISERNRTASVVLWSASQRPSLFEMSQHFCSLPQDLPVSQRARSSEPTAYCVQYRIPSTRTPEKLGTDRVRSPRTKGAVLLGRLSLGVSARRLPALPKYRASVLQLSVSCRADRPVFRHSLCLISKPGWSYFCHFKS